MNSTAARDPAASLPRNFQFFLLCGAPHKRKNWLFLGNVEAGPRAAILNTILAGAKRHRLEPWAYVKDVVMTLSVDRDRVEVLLPDRWGQSHPEHVLTHRLEESREKARRRDARRADRRKRE